MRYLINSISGNVVITRNKKDTDFWIGAGYKALSTEEGINACAIDYAKMQAWETKMGMKRPHNR